MEWYPLRGDGSTLWGRPFFGVETIDRELADISGALWCVKGGVRLLALPYAQDRPFPLAELFCFARVETLRGREYVVYCFDGNGCPLMPDKS